MNDADSIEIPEGAFARKIIHVDMDAFFASVEQRDRAELRGRPIYVGGPRLHSIVAAASYEARSFGVKGGMFSNEAVRLCPDIVFVEPRLDVYERVSAEIHSILAEYTSVIEPLFLDEAWLDVTVHRTAMTSATEIATDIRNKIEDRLGLPSSAGVSYNKFLAKMATGRGKPNGQFVIPPARGAEFVTSLPIGKFHGIGEATASKMATLGINTGADLQAASLATLTSNFGKLGHLYFWLGRGIDQRPVVHERIRKSFGRESTLPNRIANLKDASAQIRPIIDRVWIDLCEEGRKGRTLSVKLKFDDFTQVTRSTTSARMFNSVDEIHRCADELLASMFPSGRDNRLLGATISSLDDLSLDTASGQLALGFN
ncbi:DNA polymerase IV [Tardiphaga sp.]|uniref:DNA polymerase IV n=1 Tax=Tardiphaga sp. TaxID=1926292 RepID=UPI00352AD39F